MNLGHAWGNPKHPFFPSPHPLSRPAPRTHSAENGYTKVHLNSHRRMSDFDVFRLPLTQTQGRFSERIKRRAITIWPSDLPCTKSTKISTFYRRRSWFTTFNMWNPRTPFMPTNKVICFSIHSSRLWFCATPDSFFSSSLSRYRCLSISENVFLSVLMLVSLSFRVDSLLAI